MQTKARLNSEVDCVTRVAMDLIRGTSVIGIGQEQKKLIKITGFSSFFWQGMYLRHIAEESDISGANLFSQLEIRNNLKLTFGSRNPVG